MRKAKAKTEISRSFLSPPLQNISTILFERFPNANYVRVGTNLPFDGKWRRPSVQWKKRLKAWLFSLTNWRRSFRREIRRHRRRNGEPLSQPKAFRQLFEVAADEDRPVAGEYAPDDYAHRKQKRLSLIARHLFKVHAEE